MKKMLKRAGAMMLTLALVAGLGAPQSAFATMPDEETGNDQRVVYIDEDQLNGLQNSEQDTSGDVSAETEVKSQDTEQSEETSESVQETEQETDADIDTVATVDGTDDPEAFRNQRKQNNIDDNGVAMFARTVSRKVTAYGIDVSEFNGTIDWNKVKAAGVNFALIRIGYRGYGTGRLVKDANAERNLREATAAGVQVGAYFFSTAITEAEAREEAQMVIDIIKNYHITYPVVFDNEGMYLINGDKQRDYDLTSAQRTDMAIAFLDTIKAAGYTPMMYANTSCFANVDDRGFDVSRLEDKYEIWVAQYFYKNEKKELYNTHEEALCRSTSYTGNYSVWQFSSGGKIDGIAGDVDLDYWYEDVAKAQSAEITALQSENQLHIQIKNVQSSYAIGSMSIAVWSDNNGQDDLRWYSPIQNGDSWNVSVNLENHKSDTGIYNMHLYYEDLKGKMTLVTGKTIKVATDADVSTSQTDTGFTVRVSNLRTSYAVKSLTIPIWSNNNGQDDIIWYQATKSGNDWIVNINTSNHKDDTGIYNIHIYMTTNTNQMICLKGTTYNVPETFKPAPKYNEISAIDTKANGDFKAQISNLNVNYTVVRALFAIWSANNGQDDIIWYEGIKDGDVWTVNVKGSEHNYESGSYCIHVYLCDSSGTLHFVDGIAENIKAEAPGNIVTLGSVDENTSKFTVKLSNIKTNSQVVSVVMPVWTSKNGQDDIIWYEAQKTGDDWTISVDCAKHNYESGVYNIHMYYRDIKGELHFIAGTASNIIVPEKAKITGSISVKKTTSTTFRITVDNAYCATGIRQIYIPVWTNKNGQDDIIWYQPLYRNGQWIVNVSIANHKYEGGIYNIHLYYEDNNGKMNFVNAETFQF